MAEIQKLPPKSSRDPQKERIINSQKEAGTLYGPDGTHGSCDSSNVDLRKTSRSFIEKRDRVLVGSGKNNAAAIIIDNDPNFKGKNSRVSLLVGTNGSNWKETEQINNVNYHKTEAGLILGERTNPCEVFLVKDKDGNVLEEQSGPILSAPMNSLDEKNIDKKSKSDIGYKAMSSATLFADTVQIVSFDGGVNIYTGPLKSKVRGESTPVLTQGKGVSLIHGNNTKTLEPMVKGRQLNNILKEMLEIAAKNQAAIISLEKDIMTLKAALAMHVHIVLPAVPTLPTATAPSIGLAIGAAVDFPGHIANALDQITQTVNGVLIKVNNTPAFRDAMESTYHKLN
tara:strand:- start:945 stop:1967 length:1023 start_codon:yes stop_codon:yes gene_type:complete